MKSGKILISSVCFFRMLTVFAVQNTNDKYLVHSPLLSPLGNGFCGENEKWQTKILLFLLLLPQQLKITHHHINFKSQSANYISIQSEPADRWQRFHHEERGIDRFGGNR